MAEVAGGLADQESDIRRTLYTGQAVLAGSLFVFVISVALGLDPIMVAVALLTAIIALIPLAIDNGRAPIHRHLLLTLYCALFVSHFSVPIFTTYGGAVGPVDPPGVDGAGVVRADVLTGQLVALMALCMLLLGYVATPLSSRSRIGEIRARSDWSAQTTIGVAFVMIMIGVSITGAQSLGLITEAAGSGVVSTLASGMILGNVLLTVAAIRDRSRLARTVLFFAVPIAVGLGFLTGSKRTTLIVPAVMVLAMVFLGGRLRVKYMAAGVLAIVLLYPIAQFYRDVVLDSNTLTAADSLADFDYVLDSLDEFLTGESSGNYLTTGVQATLARFDAVGIESVIIRDTPGRSPFQNGRTLALFPIAFVPRIFWADKPEITLGQWITDTYGPGPHIRSYTGPSYIGDLYLNFGIISVIIGMLRTGVLMRLTHHLLLGSSPTAPGILAAVIIVMQFHTKQIGPFAYTLSSTIFALAPLAVVALGLRFLVPQRPRPTAPTSSDPTALALQ